MVRAETFYWSVTNMSTLDLDGRLRVPSLTLGGSDLYTTLTNKQNSLTINGSNTEAAGYKLANGTDNTTIKAIKPGTNMTITQTPNDMTINGPDLSTKQNALSVRGDDTNVNGYR